MASGRVRSTGDTLRSGEARFTARVLGGAPGSIEARPDPLELIVLRDGQPFRAAPVTSDDFEFRFASAGPGRYRLQVQRGTAIEALSSPIYLEARRAERGDEREPPGGAPPGRPRLRRHRWLESRWRWLELRRWRRFIGARRRIATGQLERRRGRRPSGRCGVQRDGRRRAAPLHGSRSLRPDAAGHRPRGWRGRDALARAAQRPAPPRPR